MLAICTCHLLGLEHGPHWGLLRRDGQVTLQKINAREFQRDLEGIYQTSVLLNDFTTPIGFFMHTRKAEQILQTFFMFLKQ